MWRKRMKNKIVLREKKNIDINHAAVANIDLHIAMLIVKISKSEYGIII